MFERWHSFVVDVGVRNHTISQALVSHLMLALLNAERNTLVQLNTERNTLVQFGGSWVPV